VLGPLRRRDFGLLWAGLAVSMLGDGIYLVALAWQVYQLHNAPSALAAVGFAWMAPQVGLLLFGGVLADRHERRRVLIAADVIRAVALGALATLTLTGGLELWHVVALVAVYGVGEAFFGPAFHSIVPDLVPEPELVQANAIEQMVRPLAIRLAGPAVGGLLVAAAGPGTALAIDAGTFLVSALALGAIRARPPRGAARDAPARGQLREGFAYARSQSWLWATLMSAALALLCFWGPVEVLLPFLVKNELGGTATDFGLVLATGGIGAVAAAWWTGRRPLPRRHVLVMYVVWALGCATATGFAFVRRPWEAMVVNAAMEACFAVGAVIWITTLQRAVPAELRGRVSSVDWMVSFSLMPLSFALVAPVSHLAGVDATLIAGGALACAGTLGFLLVPGVRDPERAAPAAQRAA
jgi:DHA3 family tetracycline resistance protein-like MFS transporter